MKPVNQQRDAAFLQVALKTLGSKLKRYSIKQHFVTLAAFTFSRRFFCRYAIYGITGGTDNLQSPNPFSYFSLQMFLKYRLLSPAPVL
jgi:hypothetical protein